MNLEDRIQRLSQLLSLVVAVPDDWLAESKESQPTGTPSGSNLKTIACTNYKTVITSWKKAMKWTNGLDCALSVMLSAAMSTRFVGEQLWVKAIGPPSSGKTTILEGLAVADQWIVSKDTIRGFYSGWKDDSGEDSSLAALANGKTLAIKDGDTLLKAPNLDQILSEARGLYDRVGRTHYRNKVAHEYTGHRMTMIICGTAALREIDDSELGARFLDCVVMDQIEDDFEDEVGWRAANQEARNMLIESDGKPETQYPEELAQAMGLTGGYVDYLRKNAQELVSQIEIPESRLAECNRLGKFIAFMRARPSKKEQDAEGTREFSARLVKQMVRLATALTVVLNRPVIDDEVMRRTTKVALDTARGLTLEITRQLYDAPEGLEARTIALYTGRSDASVAKFLRFLRQIHVVESFRVETKGMVPKSRWRLTAKLQKLYHDVMEEPDA